MVKRYDLMQIDDGYDDDTPADTIMGECVSGEFVRWEDYEAAAEKLRVCEINLRCLKETIVEICMEA